MHSRNPGATVGAALLHLLFCMAQIVVEDGYCGDRCSASAWPRPSPPMLCCAVLCCALGCAHVAPPSPPVHMPLGTAACA